MNSPPLLLLQATSSSMRSSDRAEQRLLWLKTLREHLSAQILPVTTSHSIDITPPTLQDSVIVALTSSSQSSISQPASTGFTLPSTSRVNNLLPLDSEIWTVERLQCFKRSFHVCLLPQFSGQPTDDDAGKLAEHSAVLVALLTASNGSVTDRGLRIKDNSGEIPCEVVLPVKFTNRVVLLKEWSLIHSSLYGNYLEIETLVYIDAGSCLSSLPGGYDCYLSVTDVQRHMKNRGPKGGVNVIGRLAAISEPVRNGPEFIVILRIAHVSDSSNFFHLITQSPQLMHLPHIMKLFEIYTFTKLKSVIMNKGEVDEAMVWTSTGQTRVEPVSYEQVSRLLASSPLCCSTQQWESGPTCTSPVRKKSRADEGGDQVVSSAEDTTIRSGCSVNSIKPDPVIPSSRNALISYKGVITRCLLPEAGVYELDDRIALYLTHVSLSNLGRGLREGAEVEISNAHVLKISTQLCKQMSGLFCCPLGRVEVLHFSKKDTTFKAYIPQNRLAHMMSSSRAMDVAWLTLVFLSLLKKLKKKREAFRVLSVLCEMVGVVRLQQTVHSSFLQQPHRCQFLESVDLSQRPLVPTLEDILQLCKEQTASAMFCWRGGKRAGVAASSSVAAAPSLSVAVSATWSFGVIKGTEFASLQFLIGTLCGNRRSGNLELSDSTAAIPLIGCIPYGQRTGKGSTSTSNWLLDVRDGSVVALSEFSVIVERTEQSEGSGKTGLSFYLHSHDIKMLRDEKSEDKQRGDASGVCKDGKPTTVPNFLYVFIKNKNALKLHGHANSHSHEKSFSGFDAQALAHSSLEKLQGVRLSSKGANADCPVAVAVIFPSARCYPYLHNGCIYRLSCLDVSKDRLPSLLALRKEPCITVSDSVLLEMVALPRVSVLEQSVCHCDCMLEVGDLVSKLYLPKMQTTFTTQKDQCRRGLDGLVSFRGVVMEHSYRIDCDTTHLTPWSNASLQPATSTVSSSNPAMRHIIALNIRGIHCPNTIMVYCKYKPQEPLPLGLLPGTVAAFHAFSLKSSARSGNLYCVNCSTSSITVETLDGVAAESEVLRQKRASGPTPEMLHLPVSSLYDLTQMLFRGCLSRAVISIRATVVSVLHAFIQFQCQGCQCTMVDGSCRPACPTKNAVLKTDARLLVQDGTGEAHLYVKDGVLPVALGMTDREWSDLLDLIYKVGQVTYTKSSMYKGKKTSRAVTITEKAESLFLEVLTRPSLVQTRTVFCQPFLSSSELNVVIGKKSHRVHVRPGTEYVTLSLPRLQLRALALSPVDALSLSHKLLTLLKPS